MNLTVTTYVPQEQEIDAQPYAALLPFDRVTDCAFTLRGYKDWSASVAFDNNYSIDIDEENGVGSVTVSSLRMRHDAVGNLRPQYDLVECQDDVVLVSDEDDWTLARLLDGINEIAAQLPTTTEQEEGVR